jgi:hypothetical protein
MHVTVFILALFSNAYHEGSREVIITRRCHYYGERSSLWEEVIIMEKLLSREEAINTERNSHHREIA